MSLQTKYLPEKMKPYFWDCNFEKLTIEEYPEFIIERVLSFGNFNDIKWLLKRINKEKFFRVALNSRRLDNRTKNFWKIIQHHV